MKNQSTGYFVLALCTLAACPAVAQKTTSFTANITLAAGTGGPLAYSTLNSTGTVNPGGSANIRFQLAQSVGGNGQGTGPAQTTMTVAFNRLDILTGTTSLPDLTVQSPAAVT